MIGVGEVLGRTTIVALLEADSLVDALPVLHERLAEDVVVSENHLGEPVDELDAGEALGATWLELGVLDAGHGGSFTIGADTLMDGLSGENMIVAASVAIEANPAGQIWAAAITALVALVVVIVNAHSDTLRKAERLAEVASRMPESSERGLVEDLRDDYVTSWALNQMAPMHIWARALSYGGYGVAGLTFTMWWAYSVTTEYASWTWWIYVVGFLILTAAVLIHGWRRASRSRWMREERANRWMRRPHHTRLRATQEF